MTMTSREQYIEKLKLQLHRWNGDIRRWEAQAKDAKDDARQRFEEQLRALRDQRERTLYKLRLLENAADAAWKDFTHGADEAVVRVRQAAEKARTHFEKKP
jgi:hypothetical protein